MSKFMSVDTALSRVAEDPDAPIADRVKALRLIAHPQLCLLRRLLVDSEKPDAKPVPARVKAAAAIRFAQETAYRKSRPLRPTYRRTKQPNQPRNDERISTEGNSLGI